MLSIVFLFFFSVSALAAGVSVQLSSWEAIFSASPIVQAVLFILFVLSIFCWAVGLFKWKQFSDVASANEEFIARFWKARSFEEVHDFVDHFKKSSMARLYKAAYFEMKNSIEHKDPAAFSENKKNSSMQASGLDNVERSLRKTMDLELTNMESRLTLLATTGSTGPFIGLFGTVWGIMGSFHKIGVTGSASLAVVAPGISEALITTAIGLAAAIPAVVLYNHFISFIRKQEIYLNNFSTDILNIVKRNYLRDSEKS